MLQECSRLLGRDTTYEVGARNFEKGHHPGQSVRREANVSVLKEEQLIRRAPGQDPAGVLLATPSLRQLRPVQQPHAVVASGEPLHDRRGLILGLIVEDHDLQFDSFAHQRRRHGGLDRLFLIACRNQDRHARERAPSGRRRRRLIRGQVPPEEPCRNGGHDERDQRDHHQGHDRSPSMPCSGRKRSPVSQARNLRPPS